MFKNIPEFKAIQKPLPADQIAGMATAICNNAKFRVAFCCHMAELDHIFTYADVLDWLNNAPGVPELLKDSGLVCDQGYAVAPDHLTGGTRIAVAFSHGRCIPSYPSGTFVPTMFFLKLLDAPMCQSIPTVQQQLRDEVSAAQMDLTTYLPYTSVNSAEVQELASRYTVMLSERAAIIDGVPELFRPMVASVDYVGSQQTYFCRPRNEFNQVSDELLRELEATHQEIASMADPLSINPLVKQAGVVY